MEKRIAGFAIALLFGLAAVVMIRDSYFNGWDFDVFYHAAEAFFQHKNIYRVGMGPGGWVFKYPPWTLPFFLPFALLPNPIARAAWAVCNIFFTIGILKTLRKQGLAPKVLWVIGIFFWFAWHYHSIAGQASIAILWVALTFSDQRPEATIIDQSTKIFLGVTAFGMRAKAWRPAPLLRTALLAALLSLPALMTMPDHSPKTLVKEWAAAAASGGKDLNDGVVRGRRNQGIPALILKTLHVPAENTKADLIVFILGAALVAGLWHRYSKPLSFERRWAGWIAIGVLCHPLAWAHSYVLVMPVCAWALQDAWNSGQRKWLLWALFACACINGLNRETLPFFKFGDFLEALCIKMWGIVIALVLLVKLARPSSVAELLNEPAPKT